MVLTQIKSYLIEHKKSLLIDIACDFGMNPKAMKCVLEHWVCRGQVRRLERNYHAKEFCEINPIYLEIYEWIT